METKGKSTGKRSKKLSVTEKNLALLQNLLLKKREEIFKEVTDLENRWEETSEPQIEVEEMAQEIEITDTNALLDEIDRRQVGEIDLALKKMDNGIYGICETCGKPIAMNRLKVIPWTRYCRKDAEKDEEISKWGIPVVVSGPLISGAKK
jgi:DnaK suppressor protein